MKMNENRNSTLKKCSKYISIRRETSSLSEGQTDLKDTIVIIIMGEINIVNNSLWYYLTNIGLNCLEYQ